jgi:P-type conjugative transfer ATPase TrbB
MKSNTTRLAELLTVSLGPKIMDLLTEPSITEIRINSDGKLWYHKLGEGKIHLNTSINADNVKQAIYAVAYSHHECCDEKKPYVSAEVPGTGERFQGVLPPIVKAPTIAIRKKAVRIFTLEDLEAKNVLTNVQVHYLRNAVLERKNILVIGGTDTGKTTFANALLQVITNTTDRLVIIEDTQELQCKAQDIEYLRSKDGIATLRDLLRTTLRLSPDRIVIGEVRGAEALDLLKAWNTGHSGGVSTIHASSASQGLSRLEQLISEAGVLPSRDMISEAVNVLVYLEKKNNQRIVKEIYEVEGVSNGQYTLKNIR